MIGGKHWGQIGFDDCKNEHDWTTDEIGALKLFADVTGVAITRDRSMEELVEANSVWHRAGKCSDSWRRAPKRFRSPWI
jgi:GAF domain-containing protein